jgi:hypothetical protein
MRAARDPQRFHHHRRRHVHVMTGGHGASIDALAVSDDRTAALSQDAFGGTRLWPTLDGRREPVVVVLPDARELALSHERRGSPIWDGSMAISSVFGGGMAKLDLVTGAFEHRACGWSFGRGTFPPHEPSEGQSICDAR